MTALGGGDVRLAIFVKAGKIKWKWKRFTRKKINTKDTNMDQLFKEPAKDTPVLTHPQSLPRQTGDVNAPSGPIYVCPVQPRRKFFAVGCCTLLFLLLLLFPMLMMASLLAGMKDSKVARKYLEPAPGNVAVAVLKLEETILTTDGAFNDQIEDAFNDPDVKAVVLRIDSPGGSAYASDFYYNKLAKLSKEKEIPVVVSMGGLCASGGYYIAMAVGNERDNVIFAEPSTWTGSIGVIIPRYDLTGLAEKIGLEPDPIKSHPLKGMGSMLRPLTEEERGILQGLVDDSFARFKEVVHAGRKRFRDAPESLDKIATGQVFTLKQALANGLVDKEGTLEDAIARAKEFTGAETKKISVFTYKRRDGLMSSLLGAQAKSPEQQAMEAISNVATPRAYYLWTQMPGWE